jgi:hypothetical protein
MTAALLDYLRSDPASTRVNPARLTWSGATAEAAADHDLQLALWLAYELPYRGLAGVHDAWEWHPGLAEVVQEWEDLLLDALVNVTRNISITAAPGEQPVIAGTPDQYRELLVHRSVCYLSQAEPHSCRVPIVGTRTPEDFRSLLAEWGLSTRYGEYLDCVPGITLLTSTMVSMFVRHRRFRAALAGHLGGGRAVVEPRRQQDVVFGARCAAYAEEQFAAWVLPRWADGQSSLLQDFTG